MLKFGETTKAPNWWNEQHVDTREICFSHHRASDPQRETWWDANVSTWTEELGGLDYMGLQRVGHNWSDLAHIHTYTHKCVYTHTHIYTHIEKGFPGSSAGKESACSAGDLGSIPGSGRSLGGKQGNPLQYSCLENSMDRGAWRATVHRLTQRWILLKWLGMHTHTHT